MLLFTIQKSLSWGGIPPALYVAERQSMFFFRDQAIIVSDVNVN
jgi:hypothetical protein